MGLRRRAACRGPRKTHRARPASSSRFPASPIYIGLAVAVGAEIGKNHEWVSAGEQRVVDRGKRIVLARRPVVASQPVQYGPDLLVVPVQVPGVVAAGPQRLDLLHGHSEYEDVLVADLLADLHIGPVKRSDRERTVEGELHVARSRRLLAGRRDLLGEIGGRDDLFGQGNPVVREEGDLDLVPDPAVGIDPDADRIY